MRVLLVDDEPVQLRATAGLLRKQGWTVTPVDGGDAAMSVLAHGNEFDVALVDLMMPRMNGLELVRLVRAARPTLRIVLTSSFPLPRRQIDRLGLDGVQFVQKTAAVPRLLEVLRGGGARTEAEPERGGNPPPTPRRS